MAAAANPVKIYEYLALGKPVVSTPVADVESFGGQVIVARDGDEMREWLRQLAACPPADPRRAFAQANSWRARARQYVEFAAGPAPAVTPRASFAGA